MPGKESLRFLIEKNYASLRPSEKQVGDFVLKNMDELLRLGLSGLAAAAGVSQQSPPCQYRKKHSHLFWAGVFLSKRKRATAQGSSPLWRDTQILIL